MQQLRKRALDTVQHQAFSVFRNAFNTANTSYGDAKPLCSTSHTRRDFGTAQSNASSSGLVLSENNLFTAKKNMAEVLDHKGNLVDFLEDSVVLMVPPALWKKALEIVQSPLKSDTANNDLNWYIKSGLGFDVMVNPWISALNGGSDTAWFLIRKSNSALHFLWRQQPIITPDYNKDTDVMQVRIKSRFSFGWTDPVGQAWGSKGDTLSYTS